ncbi:MAG: sodium:calcium antiporter, partial [Planctomycetota bacterium]
KWLIDGSIDVALAMGISERIVGLTVVAGGTGAPELVASIIAVRRGKADLAVGNVLGSNIFNLLAILGVGASIGGLAAPMEILQWDVWWMLALTLLLVPLFFRADTRIRRLEGGVILATYLAYIGSLIVRG